ncbi:MAG TPA: hypothetical protein VGI03_01220 [Verrucomicrobiae bacterium]|jgi:hypothetical protein
MTCSIEGETLKPILNRPLRTTTSLLVAVCASLTMWGFGILGSSAVIEELKSGQAYSVANLYFDTLGAKISRDVSPVSFWMNTGLHVAGALVAFILPILAFREVIIEQKRKIATRKKQSSASYDGS